MSQIYIIHENAEWVRPLHAALDGLALPYEDLFVDTGLVDFGAPPPAGVYYNRMSASSHTRGHRYAAELTGAYLAWLERNGCRVVNSSRSLALEISKLTQYAALEKHGIRTPRTIAAVGGQAIRAAAERFAGPFVLKHNRGGKGLGVVRFDDVQSLDTYLASGNAPAPVDGITLVQEYILAPDGTITRVEFIGGKFVYAVRVDTSAGFELCPADACAPVLDESCPTVESAVDRFTVIEGFAHPLVAPYERFLAANGIEVAALEFIVDRAGTAFTYDVNCNTNYNPQAEARAGVSGMKTLAEFLGAELESVRDGGRSRRLAVASA